MSHEVETAFYREIPAWHGEGTVTLDGQVTSSEEALREAGCEWLVRKEPVYWFDEGSPDERAIVIPDQYAIIRDSDQSFLGFVGSVFEPLQNIDAFKWFDPLVEKGDFVYEAAGSLRKGQIIFILASRTDQAMLSVTGGDQIKRYFTLTFGHSGNLAVHLGNTDVRIVCMNTVRAALSAGGLISIKHTSNMPEALQTVQDMVVREQSQFEATVEQYQRLAELGCDKELLRKYVRTVFYGPKFENDEKKGARVVASVVENFKHYNFEAETVEEGKTMWDGFNAITAYLSHEYGRTDDARLSNLWLGKNAKIINSAVETAMEMAA